MGMEVVEMVLDVEQKFEVEIESPIKTLGDLFLVLLYKKQQKNSSMDDDPVTKTGSKRLLSDDLFLPLDQANLVSTVQSLMNDAQILPSQESDKPGRVSQGGDIGSAQFAAVELKDLFPFGKRTFRWNRLRRTGKKQGWDVPPLRSCASIDRFTRIAGEGALYCAIYVFFLSVLVTCGLDRPLGDWGRTLFWLTLAYLPVYFVAVVVLTVGEYFLGLYRFPDQVETVGDLANRMKDLNFLKWSRETKVQEILQSSMTDSQEEIWSYLKARYADIYGDNPDEISFSSEL